MSLPNEQMKRAACSQCLRPLRTCVCLWATPIEHVVEVLILQHPQEVANAKGSARLLHLSLPNSRLLAGEIFPEAALQALLHEPLDAQPKRRSILLYPGTPADDRLGIPAATLVEVPSLTAPSQLRLVVLDATWRKSRKILYQNPLLQQLPRLALHAPPPSRYVIRKAERAGQLSTLEATCHALMQLEGKHEQFHRLLSNFDEFVAQQQAFGALSLDRRI